MTDALARHGDVTGSSDKSEACTECGEPVKGEHLGAEAGMCVACWNDGPPALCVNCRRLVGNRVHDVAQWCEECDAVRPRPIEQIVQTEIKTKDFTASSVEYERSLKILKEGGHERGISELLRERAAAWSRRSDKWHAALERERAWSRRGISAPVLLGALGLLCTFGLRDLPQFALAGQLACVLVAGLFSWRASTAKVRLETSRAGEAWVIADRMCEWYRGCIADLDSLPGRAERGELLNTAGRHVEPVEYEVEHLRRSQRVEASARFGLPDAVRDALAEVTR